VFALTLPRALSYNSRDQLRKIGDAKTYVPTETPPPQAKARLSSACQHPRGAACIEAKTAARALATSSLIQRTTLPDGLTVRKKYRLHGRRGFQAAYNNGKTWTNELLVLKALPNALPHNRFGFAVGKRLGNAVVRNRLRRQLREAVRQLPLTEGHDVIVVARKPTLEADFWRLQTAAASLFKRAGMLQTNQVIDREIVDREP
jgi:ribonuclease P protein component